jgi:hypothetical protein
MYVYSLDGTLRDWVPDIGEDQEFKDRWMTEATQNVPVEEALSELRGTVGDTRRRHPVSQSVGE